MNLYIILIIVLSISLFTTQAYGQSKTQITTERGEDYLKEEWYDQIDDTFKGTWKSQERWIKNQNAVYVPFIITEEPNTIKVEGGTKSFIYDKNNCSIQIFGDGIIYPNEEPIISYYNVIVKETPVAMDIWSYMTINNLACSTQIIQDSKSYSIITKKTNFNSILNTGGDFLITYTKSVDGDFKVIPQYTNKDINKDSTHKYSFTDITETIDNIKLDGQEFNKENTDMVEFTKEQVTDKILIFQNGDVVIKYDNQDSVNDLLWATKIIDLSNKLQVINDYANIKEALATGDTLILDPTFSYTNGTWKSVYKEIVPDTSTICPVAGTGTPIITNGDFRIDKILAFNDRFCLMSSSRWDTTSIPDTATITDVDIRYDVSSVVLPQNCDWVRMTTDPDTASAEDLFLDIFGTISDFDYISNDSGCTTVTDDKLIDLGDTANTDLKNDLINNRFSVGYKFADMTSSGARNQIFSDATGKAVELQVEYDNSKHDVSFRPMHNDNTTTITSGTAYLKNSTGSFSTSINSTGYASFQGLQNSQNITIKEGQHNIVVYKDWNFIPYYNGTRQYATWMHDVSCPRNGIGTDFTIMVNITDVHNISSFAQPVCDNNSDIPFIVSFLGDGFNNTNYNSTMSTIIVNATEYGKNFDFFQINSTTNATTFTSPNKVNSTVSYVVGTGLQNRVFNYTIQTSTIILPQAPVLTVAGLNQTAILLTWTNATNGSAPIIGHYIERNGTTLANDTGTNTQSYTDTGLVTGNYQLYRVAGWNEGGRGTFSNQVNETTQELTSGNHLVNSTVVSNVIGLTSSIQIITGSPTPNVTKLDLYNYTTLLETKTMNQALPKGQTTFVTNGTFYKVITSLSNFTIQATVTNTTGNVILTSSPIFALPNYIPINDENNGFTFNYTHQRLSGNSILQLNATIDPILFNMQCKYQDEIFDDPVWSNVTDVGYYFKNTPVDPTKTVVVTCYTNPFLFSFSSNGGLNGTLTLLNYVNTLGNLFGVPIPFFFVILFASLWTGRSAPTGIIALTITIGLMGVMGYFSDPITHEPLITTPLWGIIILITILGLFLGKRYL